MTKTQSELTAGEREYLEHLRRSQERKLTLRQYCRDEGLSVQRLYSLSHQLRRKRGGVPLLPTAKTHKPAGDFVAVRMVPSPAPSAPGASTVCRLRAPNGWVVECASWPQASWMAQFLNGDTHAAT
jgi:hypothetical protein